MAEGTIKKLTDKGFGFIKTGGEKDLFFHSKNVQGCTFDDLQEGQKVSFTEAKGPKGPLRTSKRSNCTRQVHRPNRRHFGHQAFDISATGVSERRQSNLRIHFASFFAAQ